MSAKMKVSSSERGELFWVAAPDYAGAAIRDWMETPKRRIMKFLLVNPGFGKAPRPFRGEGGRQVSDTIGLTLPASCLRPFAVASV